MIPRSMTPSAGKLSSAMRRATSMGDGGLDARALGPAPQEARDAGGARVVAHVAGNRFPRNPAPLAELAQGVEHHLANDADRARVARFGRETQDLGVGARFVPRAAAPPRRVERALQLVQRRRAGRRRRRHRRRVPEPDRARQRGEERDHVGVAPEALRQARDERARRADALAHLDARARAPRAPAPARAAPDRRQSARGAARGRYRARRSGSARAASRARLVRRADDDAPPRSGPRGGSGAPGSRSPRRSSAKPTPRREGVAPVAPRSRIGSRSRSSSSSVSTSPPSRSSASSSRRSTGASFSISSASLALSDRTSHASSSDSAMGGVAGRPR